MYSPRRWEPVDQFLGRLETRLAEMPCARRSELLLELRQHLDALIEAHEELGSSPEEAVEEALRRFGDPEQIGRRLLREWRREGGWSLDPDRWSGGPFKKAFLHATLWCTGIQVSAALGVQLLELLLTGRPADHWMNWEPGYWAAMLVAPVVAGWKTGLRFPERGLAGTLALLLSQVVPVVLLTTLETWRSDWPFHAALVAWVATGGVAAAAGRRARHEAPEAATGLTLKGR